MATATNVDVDGLQRSVVLLFTKCLHNTHNIRVYSNMEQYIEQPLLKFFSM